VILDIFTMVLLRIGNC